MKNLLTNLWKGPVTTLLGLSLFGFTCFSLYNDKITLQWDGALMFLGAVSLLVLNESQIGAGIVKAFNVIVSKFNNGNGPQLPGAGSAVVIVFALLAISVSSCGVVKKVSQQSDTKKEIRDSLAEFSEKNKQTEKITEEADTTATVKGFESKLSVPLQAIEKAPEIFENDNIKTTVRIDSAGNVVIKNEVKDRNQHYHFTKNTSRTIASSKTSKVDVQDEKKEVKKESDKNVKRYGLPAWSWLVLLLIGLALAAYLTLRKKFSILP